VLEVRSAAIEETTAEVRNLMSGAAELRVPLKVGVGTGMNWDQAH